MTKTASKTVQAPSGALALWTALRTRIREGAEDRQLRRELSPFSVALAGVAPADTAVAREIRAMLRA